MAADRKEERRQREERGRFANLFLFLLLYSGHLFFLVKTPALLDLNKSLLCCKKTGLFSMMPTEQGLFENSHIS